MKFDNIVSFSDLVALVTLVTICVTGIFSFIQYRNSVKTKRAEYMKELNDTIRNDKDIQEVMYKIDYNEHWYDEKFRNSGDFEYKVDKTLSYFSYLCYLRKMKMISEKEFAFFKYRIQRIIKNKDVICYFYDLYHFSNFHNVPFSFQYLFEYGEEVKVYNKDFYQNVIYEDALKKLKMEQQEKTAGNKKRRF